MMSVRDLLICTTQRKEEKRRSISHLSHPRTIMQGGTDIDDCTVTFQSIKGSFRHIKNSNCVNLHHRLKSVYAEILCRAQEVSSSRVDKDIQPAEFLHNAADEAGCLVILPDIASCSKGSMPSEDG